MNEASVQKRSRTFWLGFGILLLIIAGNVFGHTGLMIFDQDGPPTLFLAWASFNLVATIILLVPYRRGERWAWYAIWAVVLPYLFVFLLGSQVGPIYLGEAVVLAVGQALTYREFFR